MIVFVPRKSLEDGDVDRTLGYSGAKHHPNDVATHFKLDALRAAPGGGRGPQPSSLQCGRGAGRHADVATSTPPPRGRRAARSAPLRRESLHRRLLGAADVLAATGALVLVVSALGRGPARDSPRSVGMPLVVLLFKIAGLYDRDQLRLVHSTLDEVPVLVQLTGLYALTVTILQSVLLEGTLGGDADRGALACQLHGDRRRTRAARWLARGCFAVERCLVIGESPAGRADPREARLPATRTPPSSPRCRSRVTTSSDSAARRRFGSIVTELQLRPHHHRPGHDRRRRRRPS